MSHGINFALKNHRVYSINGDEDATNALYGKKIFSYQNWEIDLSKRSLRGSYTQKRGEKTYVSAFALNEKFHRLTVIRKTCADDGQEEVLSKKHFHSDFAGSGEMWLSTNERDLWQTARFRTQEFLEAKEEIENILDIKIDSFCENEPENSELIFSNPMLKAYKTADGTKCLLDKDHRCVNGDFLLDLTALKSSMK